MSNQVKRELFLLPTSEPIFDDAFDHTFKGFLVGAKKLLNLEPEKWSNPHTNQAVNEYFWQHLKSTGKIDPHITDSPYKTERKGISSLRATSSKGLNGETRASLLLKGLMATSLAFENKGSILNFDRGINSNSKFIFSPLYFARQFLTSPEYPASSGYVHALIRAEIFRCAIQFQAERGSGSSNSEPNKLLQIRDMISFTKVTEALQNLSRHRLKRDNLGASSGTEFIVFHILASKGILMLRFAGADEDIEHARKSDQDRSTIDDFFKRKSLWWKNCNYEFRVNEKVNELPSASELMNELDGMPIPMPGANTVFMEGVRFTRDDGLVGRVSGHAGSGKTSFALGLSAALAPLGTKTLYVSAEESPEDLKDRLTTLIHSFIRRTHSFDADFDNWFEPQFLGSEFRGHPSKLIGEMKGWVEHLGGRAATIEDCPPGLMPLLIILDGVHEFYRGTNSSSDNSEDIAELVDTCRQFGAMVLILSAAQENEKFAGLDYLVDFVISLEHRNVTSTSETPSRRLTLHKTRRQISRPGTHIFHLSQAKGFRISPHIEAELGNRRLWNWLEPKTGSSINVLQRGVSTRDAGAVRRQPLVRLYERSQILITGEGSSGKSAMALKIIAAPLTRNVGDEISREASEQRRLNLSTNRDPIQDELDAQRQTEIADPTDIWDARHANNTRRALVISFLYQDVFYRRAWKRVRPNRSVDLVRDKDAPVPKFDFDVLKMRPGHIGPEDFLKIITRKIDEAEISGFPYFGVVIDGLHNVYLQFPELEKSEMIWPLLFELLRLKNLTVVTTHTSFRVGDNATQTSIDVDASRRRIGPLLHALVQGADYTLQVRPPERYSGSETKKGKLGLLPEMSQIICNTALEHKETRETDYFWDRNRCVFYELPIVHENEAAKS